MRTLFSVAVFVVVALAGVQSSFAEVASVFVKGDPQQCWLDVKQVVLRHSHVVLENERKKTIGTNYMTILGGDYIAMVQVSQDKVKDEIGCRISVSSRERKVYTVDDSSSTVTREPTDFQASLRVVNEIAAEVKKMKESRGRSR